MSTKISFDLPDFSLVLKNATTQTLQEAGFKVEDEAKKTAPVIEPKAAKALHFKSDGQDVFTKRINHPGTKPLAIMRNAALKVQKQVGGIFQKNFKNDLKKYRVKNV